MLAESRLRVLVTGASGNVGTALLRRLVAEDGVGEVAGVVRRPPAGEHQPYAQVRWHALDVAAPDSAPALAAAMVGMDAVVHLAWSIQPSHDEELMRRTNVEGTQRVADAAVAVGVPHLVHLSSVGAYSPGPQDRAVDESWPTDGVPTSRYSVHKAAAERVLDTVEASHPGLTVARVRPGLVMQRAAGSEIGRYFLGALLPKGWVGRWTLPLVPLPSGVQVQVVHADDLADALCRVILRRARGAFNVAADPPVRAAHIAGALRAARYLPVPWAPVRALTDLTWRLRLQPTDPGWLNLARHAPLMSTRRAHDELGWSPVVPGPAALAELVQAIGAGAGAPSPVLAARMGE